jgi:hypothetical protein
MIKIICLFYHFRIVYGDTVAYNDIPRGVMAHSILCKKSIVGQSKG